MTDEQSARDVWHDVIEELCDAGRWFAGGGITADAYRKCVTTFEARKLARFGYKLSSEVARGGAVLFQLHSADDGSLLATLRADPRTGMMTIQ